MDYEDFAEDNYLHLQEQSPSEVFNWIYKSAAIATAAVIVGVCLFLLRSR